MQDFDASKKILALMAGGFIAVLIGLVGAGFYGYYLGCQQTNHSVLVNVHDAIAATGWKPITAAIPDNKSQPALSVPAAIGPETIANVAQVVSPSVVNIDVFSRVSNDLSAASEGEFFFNGNRMTPAPSIQLLPQWQRSDAGSGLVIRSDGYILTNNHVVKGQDKIKVTLSDHRSFTGKIIGRDTFSDLAVVKIPAQGLQAAKLGESSKLRPGEWAIAIGSPLGLDQTVTLGIISAIGRSISDVNSEESFIQTDAAINPGNSGGPLLNLEGEVVGINSFIRSDAQNIGFATPIDTAREVANALISRGKIDRCWVGMKLLALTKSIKAHLGIKNISGGVLVVAVVNNSPAALSGLINGDIIEKIDDIQVLSIKDVQREVGKHKPNEVLLFTIIHAGQVKTVQVKLANFPDNLN